MAVRYGAPGVVIYNFSKSRGWNRASRIPSLQLRDPDVSVPAVPLSPINWLVLPNLKPPQTSGCGYKDESREQWARSSPVSEPGGWRDTEQMAHVTPLGGGERDFVLGKEEYRDDEGLWRLDLMKHKCS
ncbi:hypothetical protein F5B21DRAFT_467519 [Xylaria acuta]|nr:hypothetical protein F5B21DRAFT_467519 [Xylaria acuta]